jgi:pSer/pThr/pTyr-binding forkhead associated (FHA) protein
MVDDQVEANFLELVEAAESRGRVAAQLAIWAKTQGLTVDDVVSGQNVSYSSEDIAAANEILSGSAQTVEETGAEEPVSAATEPTPAVGEDTSVADDEPAPAPDDSGEEKSTSFSLLTLAILVFVLAFLAAALAAGVNFVQRTQRSTPPKSRQPTASGSAANGVKKPTRRGDTIIMPQKEMAKTLTLTCEKGPHAGRTVTINRSTILGKSRIAVKTVDRPGVSTPHLYVYWTEAGLEVKDLNSESGTSQSSGPLTEKFNSIPYNNSLTLGNEIVLITRANGIECNGDVLNMEDKGLIISRYSLAVQALGYQDNRISDPHCLISIEGTKYEIKDLQSSNGVTLNSHKLGTLAEELFNDDDIQIGESVFRCRIG